MVLIYTWLVLSYSISILFFIPVSSFYCLGEPFYWFSSWSWHYFSLFTIYDFIKEVRFRPFGVTYLDVTLRLAELQSLMSQRVILSLRLLRFHRLLPLWQKMEYALLLYTCKICASPCNKEWCVLMIHATDCFPLWILAVVGNPLFTVSPLC